MANKKCMVFETLGPTTGLQIQESQNTNEVRMTGVFGVCGVKNENRRIYSKENYGMMVENLQKVIATEGLLGELEHPDSMNINLNNVSNKIYSIEMNEDGTITGTILLLDTAKGKDAKAIVAGGVPLYISSRGAGSIDESGHVTLSTIKTYDLVGTPGFAQAKLNLKANQTLECLNESAEEGNEIWAIVDESEEDDLLGDDKKDDEPKDDDAKSEKEDSNKEDKADDAEDKKEDDEDDKKDTSDEDDNNKNSDNNTTMTELKQAIDQLTEKVTSLEAELHVAQESLTENQNKLTAVEESLQKANDTINEKNDEIASLTEKVNAFEAIDYNKIESWVKDEFATEFKNELTESINSDVQTWIVENFSETVQNWICEEFAPEVQNWVCEEFAPEVQNWVCEEFAPEVQNWICEEFSPEVQNWVCEEFAPVVEGWITEEFGPETSAAIEAKVNENVSAFMENQKDSKLSEIDALLESLDNKDEALEKLVKEQATENRFAGVYVVEHMPAEYQPSWNTLNEERQNEIVRSSKAYDFTKEGVLESFWQSVDFTNAKENKVNENKDDILNNHYGAVYAQMMRLRRP
ncbi:MAG: hypothetical protein SPK65_08565 [Succinivibrio dextrinosolvens]|nr:hypothetical protein [Succinivibrio dextrinosolvens]